MGVTVSKPVVHDSGLGTLAQILGVYVGYQNMKTRRAGELRAQNRLAESGEELGLESPYKPSGKSTSERSKGGLGAALEEQRTAEETRARAEGPGLSLFPTGRPAILKDAPAQPRVSQQADRSADSLTGVTARPPSSAITPGKESQDPEGRDLLPEVSFDTKAKLGPPTTVDPRVDVLLKRGAKHSTRWGIKQAKRDFAKQGLKNPSKGEFVAGQKAMAALNNQNVKQSQEIINKSMDRMTPAGRDIIRAKSDYAENASLDDYIKTTDVPFGKPTSYFKVGKALSLNVNKGLLKYQGNDAKQREILEQASIIKSTLNEFSSKNLNPYADRLRERYGIYGRKLSRPRGQYIRPDDMSLDIDYNGKRISLNAKGHNRPAAFKSMLARTKDKKLRKFILANYGPNDLGRGGVVDPKRTRKVDENAVIAAEAEFDQQASSNPNTLPSNTYNLYRVSGGQKIGYYETQGDNRYMQGTVSEFLDSARRDYDSNVLGTGVHDTNVRIANDLLKVNIEDYFKRGGTSDEASLAEYKRNPSQFGTSSGNNANASEVRRRKLSPQQQRALDKINSGG